MLDYSKGFGHDLEAGQIANDIVLERVIERRRFTPQRN